MNKKTILIISGMLLIPGLANAITLSFGNPVGTSGDMTSFIEAILSGILNIIAFLGVLFIVIAGIIYLIASASGNENLISTAKKIWTSSLIGLALALAGPSFLKKIKEIVLNGGNMPTDLNSAPTLSTIISNSLAFLLSIIGVLAIISLTINGFLYLFSWGDSSKTEKAKTGFFYSLIGLIIAGSALIIVEQIITWVTP